MIFSTTTEYAIRILTYMQIHDEEFLSANQIHLDLKLPYKYITKLMTSLVKADLVKTKMGRTGGYYLARPGTEIFLSHIILATHDFKKIDRCVLGHNNCSSDDPCALHDQWNPIRNSIEVLVDELNLKELSKVDISKL